MSRNPDDRLPKSRSPKPGLLRSGGGESGVALAMAIVVVVVAGVMGAGILLMVRGDLESTIAASDARRAYYAADAGVQLARRHLLSEPGSHLYDDAKYPGTCRPPESIESLADSEWSYAGDGVSRSIGGGEFSVRILALGDGCGVPERKAGERYFRVYSEGRSRSARRLIEATYVTRDTDAPLAVYTAGDVTLGGSSAVSGGSVFAGGDAEVSGGASISGEDLMYGDWSESGRNKTPRATKSVAVAAVGDVSGASGETYDRGSSPAFVAEPSGGNLTYPFDPDYWAERSHLAFMEEVAREQGNILAGEGFSWPENSTEATVVYVESGSIEVSAGICSGDDPCRGTLVAGDGDVTVGGGAQFYGAVIATGDAVVEEGARVRGFVVSGGDLDVRGEIAVPGPESRLMPGSFELEVYDWREPSG